MFHACVQRLDVTGNFEKNLETKVLFSFQKFYKIFQILCHIECLDACIEY